MRRFDLIVLVAFAAGTGWAAADVSVTVTAPSIVFHTAPHHVAIERDIFVIPDFDHEVFVVSGVYWTFSAGHWYRLPKWNGKWVVAAPAMVPPGLLAIPRGKYIHYKHARHKAAKAQRKAKHHGGGHPGKGRRK